MEAKVVDGFFFASQPIFLAVVAEIVVGLPVRGLISTESLNLKFVIKV